jgi:negative regulator of sigma-B (phosphoserine phosphatase)
MSGESPPEAGFIEWGWAGRALDGRDSGDLHVVAPFADGVLIGLVDGLGHGPEAAEAARVAVRVLEAHADESVLALIGRCNQALRKTRGAVISLASFDVRDSCLTWIGIGNVDGVLLRARRRRERPNEGILTRGGVVGYQLPALRANAVPVEPRDVLVLATDGIQSAFTEGLAAEDPPQQMADSVLARHASGLDDAHVVVARFLGRNE